MSYHLLIAFSDKFEGEQVGRYLEKKIADIRTCTVVDSADRLYSAAKLTFPDIIITDILLQDGNGLQTIKALQALNNTFQSIAVCSRPNFNDAYAALNCHVDYFLLRPLDIQTIYETVRSATDRLSSPVSNTTYTDYHQVIGRLFFEQARLLSPKQQFTRELYNNMYHTNFQDGIYRIIIVCIDVNAETSSFPFPVPKLLKNCGTILFCHLSDICHETIMRCTERRVNIIVNYADAALFLETLHICLSAAKESLPPPACVTFCLSKAYRNIQDIPEMIEDSTDALWSRFSKGTGKILLSGQETPCPAYIVQTYENLEQKLKKACFLLDLNSFQQEINRLFSLPDYILERKETRHLLRRVEYYMFDVNYEYISAFINIDILKQDMIQTLHKANTLDEYKERYACQLIAVFRQILKHTNGHVSKYIRLIDQYMEEHLSENFHLKELAEYIGLNPIYLSALFKKETGYNFSDYKNYYRIEKSKKLLKNEELKIQYVAQLVGYTDVHYFSRMFKKIEGITPTEYRKATLKKRNG